MSDEDDAWHTSSWSDIVAEVMASCTFDLHEGLVFELVSEELEGFWQAKAKAGDALAVECKEIAATVDGLPIAPVVTMLRKAHQDALRLMKFLVSTASKTQRRSTPFRGYNQDYFGVTAGCVALQDIMFDVHLAAHSLSSRPAQDWLGENDPLRGTRDRPLHENRPGDNAPRAR